jgi:hypothetical protein
VSLAGGRGALITGEIQFWRMDPAHWRPALESARDLGITTVATYLSWRRHEPRRGAADLRGAHGPELDVHAFLALCRELGMEVVLKPGPWICAEEVGGGLPDWILEREDLMARDADGAVVVGYNPPFRHPMPSYASRGFRALVEEWIGFVWHDLTEFIGPEGPVVATQYDNEPSLGFRDSMYGFDRHPDALAAWAARAGAAEPPLPRRPGDGDSAPTGLERAWIAFQEDYVVDWLRWLRDVGDRHGAGHLVGSVNLNTHPVRGVPQSGERIAGALPGAVVGEDHYFVPPLTADDLAGLAIAAAQGRASGTALVWAPEVQAGIWVSPGVPVDHPDPRAAEIAAWWGAALALGYQGFNLYMLADRENWALAPLGRDGSPGASATHLRRLLATVAAEPELRDFAPVTQYGVPWSRSLLESAYRVAGTQAEPRTAWDDPVARAGYDAAIETAGAALRAGVAFHLDPAASEAAAALPAPVVTASAPALLVRLHRHADGRELLHLVSATEEVSRVEIVFADARGGALVDALSGADHPLADGRAFVDAAPGLTLLRVRG